MCVYVCTHIFWHTYISMYVCTYVWVCVCVWHIHTCPFGWGWRIHLCRGIRPPHNECPRYDTKQSDGDYPVMLELWGMQSIPSLQLLPGPFWPRLGASDWILSMDQIELKCILMLNWVTWNRTVLIFKLCTFAKLNCLK